MYINSWALFGLIASKNVVLSFIGGSSKHYCCVGYRELSIFDYCW